MDRLDFDDIELTYELRNHGERVVLVHATRSCRGTDR